MITSKTPNLYSGTQVKIEGTGAQQNPPHISSTAVGSESGTAHSRRRVALLTRDSFQDLATCPWSSNQVLWHLLVRVLVTNTLNANQMIVIAVTIMKDESLPGPVGHHHSTC